MENNTNEPLAGAVNVAAADGGVAVAPEVISVKDLLSEALGKDFKDDETALKAVKDTFKYVGEYGQVKPFIDQAKQAAKDQGIPLIQYMENLANNAGQPVDTSKFVTREEMANEQFFAETHSSPALAPRIHEHLRLYRMRSQVCRDDRTDLLPESCPRRIKRLSPKSRHPSMWRAF
jgi:hypothetical protein